MGSRPEMSSELFQQHAQGLQALARGLLHDEHAAEDVVQEAWICSANQAPANVLSPGGWLRQVTRRLALRRRRSEGRRAGHERSAALGDSETSPDKGSSPNWSSEPGAKADRQILRTVVDALLSLDEPYQSVIHMRFFLDLQPSEIAERRGVPLGTVKSQLSRGLERLRSRLDKRVGGERGQWALALSSITELKHGSAPPLPVSVATTSGGSTLAIAKGIAMDWKAWTIASAALAAAIGTTSVDPPRQQGVPGGGSADGATQAGRLASASNPVGTGGALPARGQGEVRTPVESQVSTVMLPARPTAKFEYVLEGSIRDSADWPMAKMKILVGQAGQVLNEAGYSDEDGRFRIVLRGHEPKAELIVAAGDSPLHPSGYWRVDARAGETAKLALNLEFNREFSKGKGKKFEVNKLKKFEVNKLKKLEEEQFRKLKLEHAAAGSGARTSKDEFGSGAEFVAVPNEIEIVEADAHLAQGGPIQLVDAGGYSELHWPLISNSGQEVIVEIFKSDMNRKRIPREELERKAQAVMLERIELSERELGEQVELVIHGQVQSAKIDSVHGVVVQAPAIRHIAIGKNGHYALSVRTERNQKLQLLAGGGDYGLAETEFDLSEWDGESQLVWNPVLDRGAELNGSLRSSAGESLDAWHVQYLSTDRDVAWSDRTLSKDGQFSIPNIQGAMGQVWLRSSPGQPFPAHVIGGLRPGVGEYDLIVPVEATEAGQLQLQVVDSSGEVLPGSEVRVWQEASGLGQEMVAGENGFALEDVPPGRYRIEIGHRATGYRDLGWFNLQPGEKLELGTFVLDSPGKLTIDPAGATMSSGWTLVRREGAIDATVAEGRDRQGLESELPAGDYRLFLNGRGFSGLPIELQVKSGGEAAFGLASAQWQPVQFHFELEGNSEAPVEFEISDERGDLLTRYEVAAGNRAKLHLLPGSYHLRARSDALSAEQVLRVEDTGSQIHASLSLR